MFLPFQTEVVHRLADVSLTGASAKLRKFLRQRQFPSLGDMRFELEAALRNSAPIYPEFGNWLERQFAQLVKRYESLRLDRIVNLRNEAAHPGNQISKHQAQEMHSLCLAFLSALIPETSG